VLGNPNLTMGVLRSMRLEFAISLAVVLAIGFILGARMAAKAPRKKRTRPKPRQYTIADWERA
jgi:hypothetical protein